MSLDTSVNSSYRSISQIFPPLLPQNQKNGVVCPAIQLYKAEHERDYEQDICEMAILYNVFKANL